MFELIRCFKKGRVTIRRCGWSFKCHPFMSDPGTDHQVRPIKAQIQGSYRGQVYFDPKTEKKLTWKNKNFDKF